MKTADFVGIKDSFDANRGSDLHFFYKKGSEFGPRRIIRIPSVLWSRPEPDFLAVAGAGEKAPGSGLRAVAVWLRGTVVAK